MVCLTFLNKTDVKLESFISIYKEYVKYPFSKVLEYTDIAVFGLFHLPSPGSSGHRNGSYSRSARQIAETRSFSMRLQPVDPRTDFRIGRNLIGQG